MNVLLLALACLLASFSAAAQQSRSPDPAAVDAALKAIRVPAIRAHMRFLSDSLLGGRYPGSLGYEIAARYVAAQLEAMGIQPAGENGTWYQEVPILRAIGDSSRSSLGLSNGVQKVTLKDRQDRGFNNNLAYTDSTVEGPVIFVGYGITAPELNYDDYAGADVRGKIVAVLSNAPPSFTSSQAGYYGNDVVKSRNAVSHGATGRLEIYLPDEAEYWSVSDPVGTGEWLDHHGVPHDVFPEMKAWAWLTTSGAEKLFKGAPKTLEQVFAAARAGEPQNFPLMWHAKMHTVDAHQRMQSPNVVGKIAGSDPNTRRSTTWTSRLTMRRASRPRG